MVLRAPWRHRGMGTTERGRVFACCKRFYLSVFTLKSLFLDLGENIRPRCSLFGEFPLIPFSWCSKILAICLPGSSNTFLERTAVKVGMVRIVRMPAGTGRHVVGRTSLPALPAHSSGCLRVTSLPGDCSLAVPCSTHGPSNAGRRL